MINDRRNYNISYLTSRTHESTPWKLGIESK